MHKFDYSFLKKDLLPSRLIGLTSGIASLKTMAGVRFEEHKKIFTELEKIAIVQSVKSSNAIEGIITSDERIKAIIGGSSEPKNHSEAEIMGYKEALDLIHTGYEHIDFTTNSILALHRIMMTPSAAPDAGKYKTNDNIIVEVDSQGNRRVRFRPTPASETARAMEQLELAYLDAKSDSEINGLLLIPCVILDFLCIHPFRDGNGRISRLLSLLLLYKNGFDAGKYISFEEQINKYKAFYYEALENSSADWNDNKNNYFPFIENFLSTLYMCYKELDMRFATQQSKQVSKRERIEATVLNSIIPLSKAEICDILPDVSPTTVESVLGNMVRSEKIIKLGQGRSTKYKRK